MHYFYQSMVWRKINEDIYKKPIFEIDINGHIYWGIVKEKSKGPVSLRWFQLIGLERKLISGFQRFLDNIKRDFGKFGTIMFQFGFTDEILSWETKNFHKQEFIKQVKSKVLDYIEKEIKPYDLIFSFRQNFMPATVVIDLSVSEEDLYKNMIGSARNHYNKAKKKGLYFTVAKDGDWKNFYDLWKRTSSFKGFNIIPENVYFKLKEYLLGEKVGDLFLVKKGNDIVSGSIVLFIGDYIIYLYGATNRDMGNIGGHQFLKLEMFKRGKNNGFKKVDLLGSCRPYEIDCSIYGVSKFKWSLGGKQIEYLGSWDYILDKNLYSLFKLQKDLRKVIYKLKSFLKFKK